MTFNWPDIPFSGAEVDAFVVEYKALAEAIYEDSKTNVILDLLKMPYRESENLKVFLEKGLLYATFIIKQRSSGEGPGTDFDLDNSPYRPGLTESQISKLLKNLGCVFTNDEMTNAWNNNKKVDSSLEDLDNLFNADGSPNLPPFIQTLVDTLINGSNGNPENLNVSDYLESLQEATVGEVDGWTNFLISLWEGIRAPFGINPYRNLITTAVRRYLGDDGTQITENTFTPEQVTQLRNGVQELINRSVAVWPEGDPRGVSIFGTGVPYDDVTSLYNATQQQAFNLPPGGKIVQFPTYGTDLRRLLGVATAVLDSNNNVRSIHDDFDFVYGNEVNRSGTDQIPGSPYNPNQIVNGTEWSKNGQTQTPQQVQEANPGHQRTVIIDYYTKGKGTPVPIRINFY